MSIVNLIRVFLTLGTTASPFALPINIFQQILFAWILCGILFIVLIFLHAKKHTLGAEDVKKELSTSLVKFEKR